MVRSAVRGGERHAENHANEVDVANVGVDDALVGVGQLNETPVETGAGILNVGHRRLHNTLTNIGPDNEELEFALAEVHSAGGDGEGQVDGQLLTSSWQGNRNRGVDRHGGFGTPGRRVDGLSIGADENNGTSGVQALDVGVDVTAAKVVDELERKRLDGLNFKVLDLDAVRGRSAVQGVLLSDDDILDCSWPSNSEAIGSTRGE